ncbi:Uncharacterized protein DBV15_02988 [Temnothorax longispinosus]|uniref:Uncharacterized protein n=1 Tax=Temnothorax longispinosus TaxID=300112 RepID=A0A4S2KCJ9_9HYME|nr:Uncharacterized protein DBV15_02988 [Temnothorax longispinosus]
MPAVEAESNHAGWGNARSGSGRARSLTPRLHSVMNGASCAPAAGQRPVSQLTEMNRVEPSRGEAVRAGPSRACLRDHGTPRGPAFTAKIPVHREEKEAGSNRSATICEIPSGGYAGGTQKAILERSVARAREYRATVAVGTPTTQAMTSRDASAATSAHSTTALLCCIPGPAGSSRFWYYRLSKQRRPGNFYKII